MKLARTAFRVLDPLLGWPLMQLANWRARGVVLLYHRVSSDEGPDYPPLDPEVFQEHLDLLSGLFDVLPLSEFVERLAAGRALQGCCALTFDDGYADFLTDALPAITERGLPVTHFLVVDSLLTGRIPWNARLARILRLDGSCVKEDPAIALERLSQMPWQERDALLEDWEGCIDGAGEPPPAMIRSADVGRLLAAGVEVGAHTLSHCFLTDVTSEEADRELTQSRRHLEDMCDATILFASYPQGLHNPSVESLAQRAGYRAAFVVGQRPAVPGTNLHAIPRFDVTDRPTSMLRLELSGFVPSLRRLRMR